MHEIQLHTWVFLFAVFQRKEKNRNNDEKGKGERDTDLDRTGSTLLQERMYSKLTQESHVSDLLSCQVYSSKSLRTPKDKWITTSQKSDSELALQAKRQLPQTASSRSRRQDSAVSGVICIQGQNTSEREREGKQLLLFLHNVHYAKGNVFKCYQVVEHSSQHCNQQDCHCWLPVPINLKERC